jgi:molecular chaperone DnaK (HSP70)
MSQEVSVIGIDVGITTGVVIAKVQRGQMPVILAARTFAVPEYRPDVAAFVEWVSAHEVERLVVEYPADAQYSTFRKETIRARDRWRLAVEDLGKVVQVEVTEVRPSEWKTSLSGRINVFKARCNEMWWKARPSQHERDAAAIIHYLSNLSALKP